MISLLQKNRETKLFVSRFFSSFYKTEDALLGLRVFSQALFSKLPESIVLMVGKIFGVGALAADDGKIPHLI